MLISCDIKEYKWFSELYGEDIANNLLIEITKTMNQICKQYELYCHDYSGYFSFLMKDDSLDVIKERLFNLSEIIRCHFILRHQTTTYHFHYGIYVIEDYNADIRNDSQKTNYAKAKLKQLSKDNIVYY